MEHHLQMFPVLYDISCTVEKRAMTEVNTHWLSIFNNLHNWYKNFEAKFLDDRIMFQESVYFCKKVYQLNFNTVCVPIDISINVYVRICVLKKQAIEACIADLLDFDKG